MTVLKSNVPPSDIQYQPPAYCLYNNVNITPLASVHWKYATRGPQYVALGPHDAALGPRATLYGPLAASWGPRATYCLALGRHIFQCTSARGVILLHYWVSLIFPQTLGPCLLTPSNCLGLVSYRFQKFAYVSYSVSLIAHTECSSTWFDWSTHKIQG